MSMGPRLETTIHYELIAQYKKYLVFFFFFYTSSVSLVKIYKFPLRTAQLNSLQLVKALPCYMVTMA